MIQRIQSIFLFLAALAFIAMFFLPMATSDAITAGFFSDKDYDVQDHALLAALAGIGTGLALITIFMFQRRSLQLRLGYILIVIAILIPSMAYLLFTNQAGIMPAEMEVHDEFGMFLPVIAIALLIAANYYIRKDDKLVKSMDRLR